MTRDPDSAPMTPDALFQIGSNTKSMTAAAMLQLQSEGKLSLDDAGPLLSGISGLGGCQPAPPAEHDERHPDL